MQSGEKGGHIRISLLCVVRRTRDDLGCEGGDHSWTAVQASGPVAVERLACLDNEVNF